MSRVVKLRKGLNIKLKGAAEKVLTKAPLAKSYAVKPTDFEGLIPRLCVKEGDIVKAGSPVFFDKYRPEVVFVSPVSGKVTAIVRGDRRKLLEVVVSPDSEQEKVKFELGEEILKSREGIIDTMLKAGLWPFIKQRPYGIIANPSDQPKAIFISGFDTAPLSLDVVFMLESEAKNIQKGVEILKKIVSGPIHLGVEEGSTLEKMFKGVEVTTFTGKHPAGNVGVHIHHVSPLAKDEVVWTISPMDLVNIGRFFDTGEFNSEKIIALAGSEVRRPQYYRILSGANLCSLAENINKEEEGKKHRYISGDVLTGISVGADGYLGFYDHRVSVIPEGNHYEFLGWAAPRFNKFSASRAYFSWLTPGKKFNLDTNLNGGERAFVMSDQYEKVVPMDIYPVYLLKAILAEDVEKMEQLGIYEVIEEDLALCEFVCTSKIEVQEILRKGINTMIKEMA